MNTEQTPWYDVHDPEMAALSNSELDAHIHRWSQNLEKYRQQARDGGAPRQPGHKGPGYSAWWAGKILDRGMRERARRMHRTQAQPSPGTTNQETHPND